MKAKKKFSPNALSSRSFVKAARTAFGLFSAVFIVTAMAAMFCLPVQAKTVTTTNNDTGYSAVIQDDAMLLSDDEISELMNDMVPITQNGNAVFYTTDKDTSYDTRQMVIDIWEQEYGFDDETSGSIFFIGMGTRQLYLYNTGYLKKCINSSYSTSIVDNTYSYASEGEYEKCAAATFRQVSSMSMGGTILQPMRYINSILTAIILAIFISYLVVKFNRDSHKIKSSPEARVKHQQGQDLVSSAALLYTGAAINKRISKPGINASISQLRKRTYRVNKTSSSGGGHSSGGHSSGHGFGGGHSSGGHSSGHGSGGGHRF